MGDLRCEGCRSSVHAQTGSMVVNPGGALGPLALGAIEFASRFVIRRNGDCAGFYAIDWMVFSKNLRTLGLFQHR